MTIRYVVFPDEACIIYAPYMDILESDVFHTAMDAALNETSFIHTCLQNWDGPIHFLIGEVSVTDTVQRNGLNYHQINFIRIVEKHAVYSGSQTSVVVP